MASVVVKSEPTYTLTLTHTEAAIVGAMLRRLHPNSVQVAKDLKCLADSNLPRLLDTHLTSYSLDGLQQIITNPTN